MNPHPTSSSAQAPETSVGGRGWFLAATFVVLAAAGAGAWWFLFGGKDLVTPGPEGRPVPAQGKPYVPAAHVDAGTARLSASADGTRVLDVDVRDVKPGETLLVRRRASAKTSPSIVLFLSVGDPAKAKDDPGLVTAVTSTSGPAGSTHLRVELEGTVDRVTFVDLRFGGVWEGIEVVREGAPPEVR